MTVTIVSNTSANNIVRTLTSSNDAMRTSSQRIASGLRVDTARDDIAAAAVGTRLRTQIGAFKQAIINTAQGKSMLETAEGGLSEITKILQRMKSLSIQSASANLTTADRLSLDTEYQASLSELDRIANSTSFNGQYLIAGAAATGGAIGTTAGTISNLITGFTSITYDGTVASGGFKLTYAAGATANLGGNMTITNMKTNASQTITLDNGAITGTNTETYAFDQLGITVVLNNSFVKNTAILEAANTVATTGTGVLGTANVRSISGDITDVTSLALAISATTATASTFTLNATSGNFTQSATLDLSSANTTIPNDTQTVTLTRTIGTRTDTIIVDFSVTTAFVNTDVGTITLNQMKNELSAFNDPTAMASFTFQVGASSSTNDQIQLNLGAATSIAIGVSGTDVKSVATAQTASSNITTAINNILSIRAINGATINRLDTAASNLTVSTENLEAAASTLLELDVPTEMASYVSYQVMTQTGIAMLGKSNQSQEYVLQLLR